MLGAPGKKDGGGGGLQGILRNNDITCVDIGLKTFFDSILVIVQDTIWRGVDTILMWPAAKRQRTLGLRREVSFRIHEWPMTPE